MTIFPNVGYGVAYGNGTWVAIGTVSSSGSYAYSTNGTTWTTISTQKFSSNIGYYVYYNAGIFYSGGFNSTTSSYFTQQISYDGINWVNNGYDSTVTNLFTSSYGMGTQTFLSTLSNTLVYSNDSGVTWSGLGNTIFSVQGNGLTNNGTMWGAVGQGATYTIGYSINGINWFGVSGSTSIFVAGFGIGYYNGLWVAGGCGTYSLASSPDGTTWTGITGSTSIFIIVYSVSYSNGTWIASGTGGGYSLAYSYNGTSWTGIVASSSILYSGFSSSSLTTNLQNKWIAAGTSTNSNAFAYSDDGKLWTPSSNNNVFSALSVAYGNGLFIGS